MSYNLGRLARQLTIQSNGEITIEGATVSDSDVDDRIAAANIADLNDTPDTPSSTTRQVLSEIGGALTWETYVTTGTVNNIPNRGIDTFTVYTGDEDSDGTVLTGDRTDAKYRYKGVLTSSSDSDGNDILIIRVVQRDLDDGTKATFDDNTGVTQLQFDGIEADPDSVTYT